VKRRKKESKNNEEKEIKKSRERTQMRAKEYNEY